MFVSSCEIGNRGHKRCVCCGRRKLGVWPGFLRRLPPAAFCQPVGRIVVNELLDGQWIRAGLRSPMHRGAHLRRRMSHRGPKKPYADGSGNCRRDLQSRHRRVGGRHRGSDVAPLFAVLFLVCILPRMGCGRGSLERRISLLYVRRNEGAHGCTHCRYLLHWRSGYARMRHGTSRLHPRVRLHRLSRMHAMHTVLYGVLHGVMSHGRHMAVVGVGIPRGVGVPCIPPGHVTLSLPVAGVREASRNASRRVHGRVLVLILKVRSVHLRMVRVCIARCIMPRRMHGLGLGRRIWVVRVVIHAVMRLPVRARGLVGYGKLRGRLCGSGKQVFQIVLHSSVLGR